jgi:mannose-6-phosphate isomerase-like protein (cupin superfamily)
MKGCRAMSGYSVVRTEEVPNVLGDYPGEMRLMTMQLGSEQVALTYRTMPPGTGQLKGRRTGHRHKTQEEVYFLIEGRLRVKLDDTVIEIGPGTALRVAPEVTRSMWNDGDEQAVLLMVSSHDVDPRQDAEVVPDFWPD